MNVNLSALDQSGISLLRSEAGSMGGQGFGQYDVIGANARTIPGDGSPGSAKIEYTHTAVITLPDGSQFNMGGRSSS